MPDKKGPGRFTLHFNIEEPRQGAVVNILNRQGRKKAQFITDAILHYMNWPESPSVETSSAQVDEEWVKRIVRSFLQEQTPHTPQSPAPAPAEGLGLAADIPAADTVTDTGPFGEHELAAIAKTIAAFGQR